MSLRIRILPCYVFSTVLYGAEAWTLRKNEVKKIEAFKRWCYKRMFRILWVDHMTNVIDLQKMGKGKEVVKTIKRRSLEYFGHIMRSEKYEVLKLIMEGKI